MVVVVVVTTIGAEATTAMVPCEAVPIPCMFLTAAVTALETAEVSLNANITF